MADGAAGEGPLRPGTAAPGQSVWSEELAAEVVAAVAAGGSVREWCEADGRPHRTTVVNWARAHPDFGAALGAARRIARAAERQADRLAEAGRAAALAARQAQRMTDGGSRRGGKASAYTRRLGAAICARLEAGESLTSITDDPAMPCYGAVLKWVKRFPEFQAMYVEARAVQGDYLFDEARDVALGATRESVPRARLQFDVIRWQTARLAPKKYLERLVADEARAAAEAADEAKAGPTEVVFSVMRYEKSPCGKRVLCAPPRNAEEEAAWVEATGRPYEPGVGPQGQIRPPMRER